MSEDQFKALADNDKHILSVVNQTHADQTDVWKDVQNLTLRVGSMENQLKEVLDMLHTLPRKTQDKAEEAVQPLLDETEKLKEAIKEKKVITFTEKGAGFFRRLWVWWSHGW